MATKNIAAIDVGSNSIKLLVARHDPSDGGAWSEVLREKEMVRLGQETLVSGSLSEEAMADGVDCLARYAALARAAGAGPITAVATCAVREAAQRRRIRQARAQGDRAPPRSDLRRGGGTPHHARRSLGAAAIVRPAPGPRHRRRVDRGHRRQGRPDPHGREPRSRCRTPDGSLRLVGPALREGRAASATRGEEPPRAHPQAGASREDQDRGRNVGDDPGGRRDRRRAPRPVGGRGGPPGARPKGRHANRETAREIDRPAEAPHPRARGRPEGHRDRGRDPPRGAARRVRRGIPPRVGTLAPRRARTRGAGGVGARPQRGAEHPPRIRCAARQALGPAEGPRGPRPGSRSLTFRPDPQPPSAHRARARVARARRRAARHRPVGRLSRATTTTPTT